MDTIQIVEYDPSYAQAIADMWNCSQESWGGGNRVRSAENVAQDMENAGNLRVFLAIQGNEVIGFCSFSHYKMDEGALYVPLLNVRPDYHGRKVGKLLILKAVQTTVEMGWPRLDLFTWAGNTKAVPMYKKCGFFWEKKDNAVHLMNFIPSVLQTEALGPYLERIDWYSDSLRNLDIRPDGRSVNGFDFFEYAWEKDGAALRVEFEKSGRGLRLIDTDDFTITTEIDNHDLVFGSRYPVRYIIWNKSGKPLACTIRGVDDKNIRFDLNQTVEVQSVAVIEGEFDLAAVLEEQSDWQTHPAVVSEWTINGRKAEFRTGIAPKFPAAVKLEVKGHEQYTDMPEEAFLTFENSYDAAADFEFELPLSDWIEFGKPRISVRIPAKGKETVSVPYVLRNFGLYSEDVQIKAVPDSGAPVTFIRKLHGIFKGNSGRFGGDIVDHWIAVNGPVTIGLNKLNNDIWVSHFQANNQSWWSYPRIGKPYSTEFSKKKAESVSIYEDHDAMVLEAEYRSDDFPGYAFTVFARVHANGIVEHYFEVRNETGESAGDDLYLIDAFFHGANRLILPYDGNYYDLEDRHASNYEDWDIDRISENWLFSRGDKLPHGFCWHPSASLVKTEWHFGIEHPVGQLTEGAVLRTPSTFLAIGTFTDWWDFRSYARKKRDMLRPLLRDHLELYVEGRNPFAEQEYTKVEIRQNRNQPLSGELTLSSPSGAFDPIHQTYRREDAVRSAEFTLPGLNSGTIESVHIHFEAEEMRFERKTALIPVSKEAIVQEVSQGEAGEIYRCSNGSISIEASPAFGAALHSLIYDGEEWLDSSFPEPGPRSWWNPWHGGISADIQGMSPLSLLEERRSAGFSTLTDSRGNEWSGIALHTAIEKHKEYRGIELSLFTLLLPGAPVLCCVTRLTNRTGLSYNHFSSTINSFFRAGSTPSEGWMETSSEFQYRCGKVGMSLDSKGLIRFGSDNRSAILHAVNRYPGSNAWMHTNNQIIHHGASEGKPVADGETVWMAPVFFAFAERTAYLQRTAQLGRNSL